MSANEKKKSPVESSPFNELVNGFNKKDLNELVKEGVIIPDFTGIIISDDAVIGTGTVILPNTIILSKVEIGEGCIIGPSSVLSDTKVGNKTVINFSLCFGSKIGDNTTVGPYAHLRPGSDIGNSARVGNFVEIKNSVIGDGSKISHLTYVGDSDVGKNVNFGCGCVTVNYDGKNKMRTIVEDNAFIGCNTNLIAPVKVGKNAYTAAGSTITEDVPDNSLAIARERQVNKENWVRPADR